ncbi:MAG: MBL fold metallo-hydrolase [Pirellulaceae bacterium]|nr:MBL fold metallo-hydrolase [Planctomycetales bacterium]
MKITFLGANRQVTGSRYCLETDRARVLIDCGMFQERPYLDRNWATCPVPASDFDAVVLTHAHIDHCGLLPRFVKDGFHNSIYCTRPTADLVEILLKDAARIQVEDAKYKAKRHRKEGRQGKHPPVPLYDEQDAEATLPALQGVTYNQPCQVAPGMSVTFHEAGHILGSSSLELNVDDGTGSTKRIVFSGDVGQWNKPIIRDPVPAVNTDYLVMESTYGDSLHEDHGDIGTQLADVINSTIRDGGNVIIPTFAVERAQELMYYIGQLAHDDRIPDVPIFLDSPMAVDVTETFYKHRDAFDEATWNAIGSGKAPLRFPGLRLVRSTEDSKRINEFDQPCVIMSTAGMCNAGRIKHHLRHNIVREECAVVFVGYQGVGTLGREIKEGSREVRIHGRSYRVRARIASIYGFSGHGDRDDLLRWSGQLDPAPKHVFLTHGEEPVALALADTLRNKRNWNVSVPHYLESFTLE